VTRATRYEPPRRVVTTYWSAFQLATLVTVFAAGVVIVIVRLAVLLSS
jgi:hypothetical protein